MTRATCDTCPNKANLPLVIWGDVLRCDRCARVTASPSGFDDVEWWDMTDLAANVQAYNEPRL